MKLKKYSATKAKYFAFAKALNLIQKVTMKNIKVLSLILAVGFLGLVVFNKEEKDKKQEASKDCLLYTSPSPRDRTRSRMPSSA